MLASLAGDQKPPDPILCKPTVEEEVVEEIAYIYHRLCERKFTVEMDNTLTNQVAKVVRNLNNEKPHETPNHAVIYGTNGLDNEMLPFVVVFNSLAGDYTIQMQGFGIMLKNMGIYAKDVVLVINGTMPDLRLRPVSIVLGMSRGGDYHQVVVDFNRQETYPSDNITDEDKAICAAVFLGQALYQPELDGAKWN